jgi:hypothetical protein
VWLNIRIFIIATQQASCSFVAPYYVRFILSSPALLVSWNCPANGTILGKSVFENIVSFLFSLQLLSLLGLRPTKYATISLGQTVTFVTFWKTFNLEDGFIYSPQCKSSQKQFHWKIISFTRTDRLTQMTKLVVAFGSFVKASTKRNNFFPLSIISDVRHP